MYIYEVNISGPSELETKYLRWLEDHISEMLELPVFESADYNMIDIKPNIFGIRVRYKLKNKEQMKVYTEQYSDKMRGNTPPEFKSKLSYFRCNYHL